MAVTAVKGLKQIKQPDRSKSGSVTIASSYVFLNANQRSKIRFMQHLKVSSSQTSQFKRRVESAFDCEVVWFQPDQYVGPVTDQ